MKTSITVVLVTLSLSFFSLTTSHAINEIESYQVEERIIIEDQEATVRGVYKGHDASGYNFNVVDSYGNETAMTFHKVDEAVAKANDLTSESSIGKTFEIIYDISSEEALDSNGETVNQETRIIKALKTSR